MAEHGQLGAGTRFAGHRFDLHHAVEDFRNLHLKQALDQPGWVREMRRGALIAFPNVHHIHLHAIALFELLVADLLGQRKNGFGFADLHRGGTGLGVDAGDIRRDQP